MNINGLNKLHRHNFKTNRSIAMNCLFYFKNELYCNFTVYKHSFQSQIPWTAWLKIWKDPAQFPDAHSAGHLHRSPGFFAITHDRAQHPLKGCKKYKKI